jgi:hypothetical protein
VLYGDMIAQIDPLYIKLRPWKAFTRLMSHLFFQGRPLTTKGQWLNYPLSAMLKGITHMPQTQQVEKPIFIIGTGRSGTTILGKVLSLHRDVGFLNEPKLLWHIAYPKEDLIGSYTQGPASYRLNSKQATKKVHQRIHRLYGFYLLITGAKRILDKYPEMIFRISFIRKIFPDGKFILLVRNGWDTISSIASWSKHNKVTRHAESCDWWGVNNRKWRLLAEQVVESIPILSSLSDEVNTLSRQEDMAAVEWTATMYQGLQLMEEMPEQIHLIRYENMIHSPQRTLSKITDFCELQPDTVPLVYGSKALTPRSSNDPTMDLHPAIQEAFEEMMTALGYTT